LVDIRVIGPGCQVAFYCPAEAVDQQINAVAFIGRPFSDDLGKACKTARFVLFGQPPYFRGDNVACLALGQGDGSGIKDHEQ